jgi:hypothetical protein
MTKDNLENFRYRSEREVRVQCLPKLKNDVLENTGLFIKLPSSLDCLILNRLDLN